MWVLKYTHFSGASHPAIENANSSNERYLSPLEWYLSPLCKRERASAAINDVPGVCETSISTSFFTQMHDCMNLSLDLPVCKATQVF